MFLDTNSSKSEVFAPHSILGVRLGACSSVHHVLGHQLLQLMPFIFSEVVEVVLLFAIILDMNAELNDTGFGLGHLGCCTACHCIAGFAVAPQST